MIEESDVNDAVRKLELAHSISPFHFRDAVQELMESLDGDEFCEDDLNA